jgi:hypothetical protein
MGMVSMSRPIRLDECHKEEDDDGRWLSPHVWLQTERFVGRGSMLYRYLLQCKKEVC